jgi:phosphohistidine phosphatase
MKILGLLRHAKSSRDDPHLADVDRPLTPRGVRAAELMGAAFRKRDATFDLVLASPARRVIDTIEHFETGYGKPLQPTYEPVLCENSARTLLNVLTAIGDSAERILLVGHNPSLHNLGTTLASSKDALHAKLADQFPTAAAVLIELPAAYWPDVKPGTGRILWLLKPRELEIRNERRA